MVNYLLKPSQAEARFSNHRIFHLRCWRGGFIPTSSNVKPLAQNITESVSRSSVIALHILETEHHVGFDNPEILSKYWPIYRDRITSEQWFTSRWNSNTQSTDGPKSVQPIKYFPPKKNAKILSRWPRSGVARNWASSP